MEKIDSVDASVRSLNRNKRVIAEELHSVSIAVYSYNIARGGQIMTGDKAYRALYGLAPVEIPGELGQPEYVHDA